MEKRGITIEWYRVELEVKIWAKNSSLAYCNTIVVLFEETGEESEGNFCRMAEKECEEKKVSKEKTLFSRVWNKKNK